MISVNLYSFLLNFSSVSKSLICSKPLSKKEVIIKFWVSINWKDISCLSLFNFVLILYIEVEFSSFFSNKLFKITIFSSSFNIKSNDFSNLEKVSEDVFWIMAFLNLSFEKNVLLNKIFSSIK